VGILAVAGDLHVSLWELAAGAIVLLGMLAVISAVVVAIGIGIWGPGIL
jgi:hypothetical protein